MPDREIIARIAQEMGHPQPAVRRAASLLDEGNTVPFIARYRKEATGEMDEKMIRTLDERLTYLRGMQGRREKILARIEEQGKLTEELTEAILQAETLQQLDDLYLPFRPKRRTRASVAREKGLEPLADRMLAQEDSEGDPLAIAGCLMPDGQEMEPAEALSGARDIAVERVSEDSEVRGGLRRLMWSGGAITVGKNEEGPSPYDIYFDFSGSVAALRPHQVLAINRGEREGFLKVGISMPEESALGVLRKRFLRGASIWREHVQSALVSALKQRLQGAMARECRRTLTERAEAHAIEVFDRNLTHLLMQAPIKGRVDMGIDPAFRTGCKVAVVDPAGRVLHTGAVFPQTPQRRLAESAQS
ncbi:MAG: Tex-like N-terminal domain-containing protein, partial [Bacillota bacterium]